MCILPISKEFFFPLQLGFSGVNTIMCIFFSWLQIFLGQEDLEEIYVYGQHIAERVNRLLEGVYMYLVKHT